MTPKTNNEWKKEIAVEIAIDGGRVSTANHIIEKVEFLLSLERQRLIEEIEADLRGRRRRSKNTGRSDDGVFKI